MSPKPLTIDDVCGAVGALDLFDLAASWSRSLTQMQKPVKAVLTTQQRLDHPHWRDDPTTNPPVDFMLRFHGTNEDGQITIRLVKSRAKNLARSGLFITLRVHDFQEITSIEIENVSPGHKNYDPVVIAHPAMMKKVLKRVPCKFLKAWVQGNLTWRIHKFVEKHGVEGLV